MLYPTKNYYDYKSLDILDLTTKIRTGSISEIHFHFWYKMIR